MHAEKYTHHSVTGIRLIALCKYQEPFDTIRSSSIRYAGVNRVDSVDAAMVIKVRQPEGFIMVDGIPKLRASTNAHSASSGVGTMSTNTSNPVSKQNRHGISRCDTRHGDK